MVVGNGRVVVSRRGRLAAHRMLWRPGGRLTLFLVTVVTVLRPATCPPLTPFLEKEDTHTHTGGG